jgi:hypothetical protein
VRKLRRMGLQLGYRAECGAVPHGGRVSSGLSRLVVHDDREVQARRLVARKLVRRKLVQRLDDVRKRVREPLKLRHGAVGPVPWDGRPGVMTPGRPHHREHRLGRSVPRRRHRAGSAAWQRRCVPAGG